MRADKRKKVVHTRSISAPHLLHYSCPRIGVEETWT